MAEERIMKGRRAQAALRHRCSQLGISVPAMKSKLFDVIVRSTMGYGGEMWGPGYLMSTAVLAGKDKAEVLHRGFLKKILGVRTTSHDAITYSEFGRYPLRCSWQRSIYSYWKRITELSVVGGRAVVTAAVKDNMELAAAQVATGRPILQQAWAGKVAALLARVGVDIDLAEGPSPPSQFSSEIEGAGREQHLEALRNDNRTRMATYKNTIKGWTDPSNINSATYVMQHYLEIQMPARRRFALANLRSSGHDLRVEVERHQRVHPRAGCTRTAFYFI